MKLQAYIFCGYYEHGRVMRPPPDPEIVDVSSIGHAPLP